MERIPILAMVLWLAVTGMARAQTIGQANTQVSPASPPAALLSPDTGSSGIAGSTQSVCSTASGCDPLSVPTSSSANAQAGSVSASTGAAAGTATGASSPSANPETAQQLPGEAPNGAAANSAKSTASATGSSGTPAAASPRAVQQCRRRPGNRSASSVVSCPADVDRRQSRRGIPRFLFLHRRLG